jgi:ribosomal protein S21
MAKRKNSKRNDVTANAASNSSMLIVSNNNLFEEHKDALREFSKQLPAETSLPTVPTEGGLFGWFDHIVTGSELNKLATRIQDFMIEQNKEIVKIFQEFHTIYDTFSFLDTIYVQEIIRTLNSAVIVNDKANESLIRLEEHQIRIEHQQLEIKATQDKTKQLLDGQRQIIRTLKSFKEQLERQEHLTEIDTMFYTQTEFIKNFEINSHKTDTLEEMQNDLVQRVDELLTRIEEASERNDICFRIVDDNLRRIEELQIDLSNRIESQQTIFREFEDALRKFKCSFKDAQKALDTLRVQLADFTDKMEQRLSQVEENTKNQKGAISSELSDTRNKMNEEFEGFRDKLSNLSAENSRLLRQLFYSRIASFASLSLTVVLFILILMGVLR